MTDFAEAPGYPKAPSAGRCRSFHEPGNKDQKPGNKDHNQCDESYRSNVLLDLDAVNVTRVIDQWGSRISRGDQEAGKGLTDLHIHGIALPKFLIRGNFWQRGDMPCHRIV
ncbi:hypothetical protein [Streptosporangium sp. NBC_01756]|uniref:hypothetical protein n=1 Tax=Streptosporangium sp. NBC_01756 TaxID=2975950 RepID=UPI002DD9DAE0|nr:hypothetical protein [Streptosporangium sp. NBC_01756]WSC84907.1 hypothetical protein OIE48_31730 [Streptosporangium sp. NBC_01756]